MASNSPPEQFMGWLADSSASAQGSLRWSSYTPKPFTTSDVEIKISHCGICGSDLHTLRSGWGPTSYPVCVGHEIIGRAVRVGTDVQHIHVGDRVGVGAQSGSCLRPDCAECKSGMENYCSKGMVGTYNSKYNDGSKAMGGYAKFTRVTGHFVFAIPDRIAPEHAAVMLCAGITSYTPLVENGAGPGIKVGIVGIGGLGHFGILWARALGCDSIAAISRGRGKEEDARKMGATDFIATAEEKWAKKHARSLDLIISTVGEKDMPMGGYLSLLKVKGTLIQVGAPEGKLPGLNLWNLLGKGTKLGGSSIGSPQQIREMLDLAAAKNVQPWVKMIPMKEANRAIVEFEQGKPRYRFVLVNEEEAKI